MTLESVKIAVFDLEMPSARRDAISAVGITLIERGEITNSYYTLVNPECSFDPFTVELTGITPEAAAQYPDFGALWEDMRPFFDGAVLAAHGAPGDLHVLARALRRYRLSWQPTAPFLCTYETARLCFPDMERYGLGSLCKALDIPLEHHVASSDATAAAQLLLACFQKKPDLLDTVKEYDMLAAKIVGVQPKKRRSKRGKGEIVIERDLRGMAGKKFARARRLQYRGAPEEVLGVLPKALKRYAQKIQKSAAAAAFLAELPHTFLEEDLLHAYLINGCRDKETCLSLTEAFLPYVENDDVFYALNPKALLSDPALIQTKGREWGGSDAPYTAAFGIKLLARAVTEKTPPIPGETPLPAALVRTGHPTVTLCAADCYFRLLKYGGNAFRDEILTLAEQKDEAACRGLYAFEKDAAALGTAAEINDPISGRVLDAATE